MVAHAAQLLWSRLSAILKITAQPTNGPLAVDDLDDPYANVAITDDTLLESGFASHFADAVKCAYGEDATPDNIGQKILADFVWSARVVLIGNPVIEALNGRFPAFGSHVFSVINKGPQSRVPATLEEEQRRVCSRPSPRCRRRGPRAQDLHGLLAALAPGQDPQVY